MARRRNLSELLITRFACPVSWDDMAGGAESRFCGECRCQVFDFAQMEPRAVKARLEASGGQLCARVTRKQGRIQMLAPPSLPAAEIPRKAERATAIAAGLFGAWLGLAAAQASASPPSPALAASAAAEPPALPVFGFRGSQQAELPGSFSDTIEVNALTMQVETVTVGMVVYSLELTLRELFEASDLVFAGRVDSAQVLSVNDGVAEVRTVLRVARFFKGTNPDRFVTYRHSLPVEAFGPEQLEPVPELTPGSMVVAFLVPAEDEAGRLLFEAVGYSSGLREFAPDELATYSELLEDLATLRRVTGPEGELDPTLLMEWLVAATEDPLTRQENTAREILSALEGIGADGDLGAILTEAQKVRLAAALLATPTMSHADIGLYRLVRKIDEESAARWLADTLRSGTLPSGDFLGPLYEFAEALEAKTAEAFLDAVKEQLDAIDERWPDRDSPEADEERQRQRDDLAPHLFAELVVLLENGGN